MPSNIRKELAALERMPVPDLREKYVEVFGEPTRTNNKAWLVKRIAWRMQALAEGDLSERARQRAAELANDADLRLRPPKVNPGTVEEQRTTALAVRFASDHRLPPVGTILTRTYKDRTIRVTVLSNGFEHEGDVFRSLSAVAKAITGTHCNGYSFFRINKARSA